jgi:hypothetical protein
MPPAEVPAFAPLRKVGLSLEEDQGARPRRIRASARELAQAGLLEETEGTYRVTALGRQKL